MQIHVKLIIAAIATLNANEQDSTSTVLYPLAMVACTIANYCNKNKRVSDRCVNVMLILSTSNRIPTRGQ